MALYLKILSIILLFLLVLNKPVSSADEDEANRRALEAAKVAAEAVNQALEAQKAVEKAVEAAKKAAEEAKKLGEQAQWDLAAKERQERIQQMPLPPSPPQVTVPVYNPVDAFIAAKWPEDSNPSVCDDLTFLRRVYLDIVGYIPKADEIETFLQSSEPDKRSKKIDELLARDEDYAIHWSQFWEDALCSNGNHQGGVGTRPNFQPFILDSFKNNKPYDIFAVQLMDPEIFGYYKGYIKSETHLDSVQTAANVGQVFLGTRMKCASCHDHFLNFEWTQRRFMGFASFFSDKDLELIRCEVKQGETIKPAFIFDNDSQTEEQLDSLPQRLTKVAKLIVDPANPRFATAFVNRLWKRYMGLGLVEPVDDFQEANSPSHPELLHWLSYEFASHDYDIKHMIRLILNSRTYQLEFNADWVDSYSPGMTVARLFRSPAQRRLTCEQIMDSLTVALEMEKPRMAFDATSNGLTRALGRPETRNEVITVRSDDVAVIQTLEMMNGPEMNTLVYDSPLTLSLTKEKPCEEAVQRVFLKLLTRNPNPEECQSTLAYLGEKPSSEDWGDVLWALVVSPQYQYVY